MINKALKDKKYFILLLIIITIISTLPLFIHNITYGGDLNFHLKRIEAISLNMKYNLIGYPIYFKYLNNYGYASGLFYPDLFLYIPAFLYKIGIPLFTSYKIFLFIIKFLSLISIYCAVKAITKNQKSGMIAIILYAFSSYPFIDMFERGALAETLTIIFIPIAIRGIYEIIIEDSDKYYILAIGMIGIQYSHIISLYIVTIFLIIFTILNIKKLDKKKIIHIIKSIIIFLLISSHFLLPLIEQMIDGNFYYNIQNNTLIYNSVPILYLFFEFPYYSLIIDNRWIPCGIGIIYLYLCIYYIKNKEKFDKISKMFLFSGILCLLFATKIPYQIKTINKVLSIIQFPYRIYILSTILFIICFSNTFKNTNIKKIFIISFTLFLLNLFYPFCNTVLTKLTDDEIMYGEYLPIEYPNKEYSTERLDKIISDCSIKYDIEYGPKTRINYKSKCDYTKLELPIIYYKGYKVTIDEKVITNYKSGNGLIQVETDIKEGTIEIYYSGTKIYNITKYITIFSFIGGVFIYVKKRKNNIRNNINNRNIC